MIFSLYQMQILHVVHSCISENIFYTSAVQPYPDHTLCRFCRIDVVYLVLLFANKEYSAFPLLLSDPSAAQLYPDSTFLGSIVLTYNISYSYLCRIKSTVPSTSCYLSAQGSQSSRASIATRSIIIRKGAGINSGLFRTGQRPISYQYLYLYTCFIVCRLQIIWSYGKNKKRS